MDGRLKIAVCFFGITRRLKEHTLDSIQKCLLGPIARHDPDYKRFAHFNTMDRVDNPRAGEQNISVDPQEFRLLNCDAAAHTDQHRLNGEIDFEAIRKFGDAWGDGFRSLQNLLCQLYSLNQVTELLLRAQERFDVVIYSRADLRFEKEIVLPNVRPRTLYTAWFGKGGGLNDRFALGDSGTMVRYGQRGALARQYCEETGKPLHAERFLLWYCRKHRLRHLDLTSIDFCRVRATGAIPAWDLIVRTRRKDRYNRALRRLQNWMLGQRT
jgi:hypothetical protein